MLPSAATWQELRELWGERQSGQFDKKMNTNEGVRYLKLRRRYRERVESWEKILETERYTGKNEN